MNTTHTLSAMALLLSGTAATAQTAQQTPAAEPAAGPGIQEIVVTAQKRSEGINKVPLSVSAASGAELKRAGVFDTRDLAKITPGFTYADTSVGVPVYTLRGIGFYDQSFASTPAVSVYNDEVPMTYPLMTRGAVLDLERVEVLKGPQGTLFGQNATGGAINYVAAKPTSDYKFGLDAGYGRFGEANLGGFISGPLTDTLTFRVAAQTTQRSEGWQISSTRGDTLGRMDKTLGRAILEWKPTTKLTVRLTANAWHDRSETQAAQLIGTLLQVPSTPYPVKIYTAPLAQPNDRSADWGDTPFGVPQRDQTFFQTSLRADYLLTDAITVTSISAYSHLHDDSSYDSDGVAYNAYDYHNTGYLKTFYQELRLTGRMAKLNWVAGVNYEHDDTHQLEPFVVDGTTTTVAPGFEVHNSEQKADTGGNVLAGYANLEYHVLDTVTLQGGVRYTDWNEHGAVCGASGPDNNFGRLFDILVTELSGGATTPNLQAGDCYTMGPAPTYVPGLVATTLHEHNTSWKAGASWNVTNAVLAYANVSRGYKSGGFPGLAAAESSALMPYHQESVLAYELGEKATLFNRRLQVNAAAFYYDYSNKQTLGNYLDPVFGIQPIIVNIPKSRIWGLEGQLTARPVDGLRLSLSGTYLNSRIQRYVGYDTLANYGDQAGTALPFTPDYSVASDIEYSRPVGTSLEAFAGAGLTYNSRTNAGIGAPAALTIDPYALLDLRAGVRTRDQRWALTAYAHNVTNRYYWTTVLHIQDGIVRYAGMPATYGFTLSYRY
jgi:iron complex outermembrane recepter protein